MGSSSAKRRRVESRLTDLTDRFDEFVVIYDEKTPFVKSKQYALHRASIDRRRSFSSVGAALEDDEFLRLLRETLQAWGIGRRASRLVDMDTLAARIRVRAQDLVQLDDLSIERLPAGNGSQAARVVWRVLADLRVVENASLIVSGSKTLHQLLPDLVPPMDRAWTGRFFEWTPADLQGQQQERTFVSAFVDLAAVASETQPSRLAGPGWRTSAAKIVDNAVVACSLR